MSRNLRIVYLTHSLRSDWNNGNAHFLRGLLRGLHAMGHFVTVLEPEHEWSIDNLRTELAGERSVNDFTRLYPEIHVQTYDAQDLQAHAWSPLLSAADVVILHEWNPTALATLLLHYRNEFGYKLLFHDTHHRASSSPEAFDALQLASFDGVLAFGDVLRRIYQERFGMDRVWVLHEAADTSIFHPYPEITKLQDIVWIGNWGDDERSAEIQDFLLTPAAALSTDMPSRSTTIYGVRYPLAGLEALRSAGARYGGYLPNLDAPTVYARSRLTVHIPRRQYATAMPGIPTIRVFEALACGIPLISAPWQDAEHLFRPGDLRFADTSAECTDAMRDLLANPDRAADQAARGLETVLARHTCDHRAQELTTICQELLS